MEIGDGSEDAALGRDGEEALDRVESADRGRSEVEGPAVTASQSLAHGRMRVGSVAVGDRMDDLGAETNREIKL